MRHFGSHAYRTEDDEGVWAFAAGSMRTYLILKAKAERFARDAEIQAILSELKSRGSDAPATGAFSADGVKALRAHAFDLDGMRAQGYAYERLDQLTIELLMGLR
jgi:xylose isomerase